MPDDPAAAYCKCDERRAAPCRRGVTPAMDPRRPGSPPPPSRASSSPRWPPCRLVGVALRLAFSCVPLRWVSCWRSFAWPRPRPAGRAVPNGDGCMLMNPATCHPGRQPPTFTSSSSTTAYEDCGRRPPAAASRFRAMARAAGISRVYAFAEAAAWQSGGGRALGPCRDLAQSRGKMRAHPHGAGADGRQIQRRPALGVR